MLPTAVALIDGIRQTLDGEIIPDLTSPYARDQARIVGYLLEHLARRVAGEGPLLFRLIGARRELLQRAATELDLRSEPALAGEAADIRAGLARQFRAPGDYPSVASLSQEYAALGDLVEGLIRAIETAGAPPELAAQRREVGRLARSEVEAELQFIPRY